MVVARALALMLVFAGAAEAAEPAWRYEVDADVDAKELRIDATLAPGYSEELSVDDGAEPFVRDVVVEEAGKWRPVAARGDSWFIPSCAKGCRLRYRFELRRAAERLDGEAGQRLGGVIQAPPSTWLLHPLHPAPGRDYRFRVRGATFVSGVRRVAADSYGADVSTLLDSAYSAFGAVTVQTIKLPDAAVEVAFVPSQRNLSRPGVMKALARAAEVVRRYYRRFPVERLLVIVVPIGGDELHGRTLGGGGATLMLSVPEGLDEAALMRSWVPAHELVHLALPTVPRKQLWLAEGLATYLEPIARARAGDVGATTVWRDLVDGLPQGLPEPGDRGLDHTHSWGRTYWGGALYCFVADLEIRERTHNRRSLDDAMRAIVAAGGSLATTWPLERALRIGDAATGVDVLSSLYRRMADAPLAVDLPSWWARLGIHPTSDGVRFDDSAPLAAIRRSVTAP
ncbi:MAG: uncharacterized protein JWN44_3067 [Myxococcales bacterium]|nr:uncharacterized protein [Myxococcales bacterium]